MSTFLDILYVALSVVILWKTADWFVEGAVGIAAKLNMPEMLVGIVLVSLATTAPELTASLMAALKGIPEVALGNAVGSVIVDDSLALGLAAATASTPLVATPHIFKTSAVALVVAVILCVAMALDGTLTRIEGALLVSVFAGYTVFSYRTERRRQAASSAAVAEMLAEAGAAEVATMPTTKVIGLFVAGLLGVLLGSQLLLTGALGIAEAARLPEVVVGLTIVAFGTSLPEIATCITAARKQKSAIAIGNILGADILNICWVAGLSAVANPLDAPPNVVMVMFPAMVAIVAAMLLLLRMGYALKRWNGFVLISLYVIYVTALLIAAPPGSAEKFVGH